MAGASLSARRHGGGGRGSARSVAPRAASRAVRFNTQNLQRSRRRNYTNQHNIASRSAPRQAAKETEAAPPTEFVTEQKFKIPKGSVAEREFLECVENRRTLMEKHEGFISASVESPLDELWVYSTRWVEKVNWEEYMWSKEATLSQMPVGMWQYPQDPKKGIGEPYVPILRLEDVPQ